MAVVDKIELIPNEAIVCRDSARTSFVCVHSTDPGGQYIKTVNEKFNECHVVWCFLKASLIW